MVTMRSRNTFLSMFPVKKPIIGMLHLKGNDQKEMLDRALLETEQMISNGVNAVIVENYFGTVEDVQLVLEHFHSTGVDFIYGVNVLEHDKKAFDFANKYGASFIQLDSVAGHLPIDEDKEFEDFINKEGSLYNGFILGGVRFKYQPYKSGRSLEEDLRIGMKRCDAIVVTGDATGEETPIDKVQEFRRIIGDFPLIIGAGMTSENLEEYFAIADAAIVGSYFKEGFVDKGDVMPSHIKKFMQEVQKYQRLYWNK